MATFHSQSAEETKSLASKLAPALEPGDILLLNGDLGAGKTQFSQGVAASLGIIEPVTSPTFTILAEYASGRLPLYHFDLYRLESEDELDDIGYFDMLEGDGACLVEWADKFPDAIPEDYLEIQIGINSDGTRTLTVAPSGPRSKALHDVWTSAL